MVCHY